MFTLMKIKDSCEPISAKKNQLRKKIKIEIAEFIKNQELYEKLSIQAQKHFLNTQAFLQSQNLFAFISLKTEISTSLILHKALKLGKKVAVPKVISETQMEFFWLKNEMPLDMQLSSGSFGILEPVDFLEKVCEDSFLCSSNSMENSACRPLMLLPALAFSPDGFRLGKGKGYYDRYIAAHERLCFELYGFCFSFQLLPEIPHDSFDRKAIHLITENGLIF